MMVRSMLVMVCASLFVYTVWIGGARRLPRRGIRIVKAVLIAAAVLAMTEFSRNWVFPLGFGLMVGCLLADDACS